MPTVFFSYSHKDEVLRDELETHLAMLKRQGVIEAWHDRRIVAGDEIGGAISENLEEADIVLLLVSPYFLASDYCYDVEMKRALARHESGDARVIPVILHPCDWHSAPFGKLLAVPRDGKPVSKYPNQHDAFLEIVQAVRTAATTKSTSKSARPTKSESFPPPATAPKVSPRSSNLRVKQAFTDHDRDAFLEESFEYVANFFEGSLTELSQRNPQVTTRFRRIDANRFSAAIYKNGESVSECGIRLESSFGRCLAYASDPNATNSMNESLSVTDNGHSLLLKSMGMSMSSGVKEELSPEGGAELFWGILMRPLQQ